MLLLKPAVRVQVYNRPGFMVAYVLNSRLRYGKEVWECIPASGSGIKFKEFVDYHYNTPVH